VEFKAAAVDKLKEFPSLKYTRFITGTFMDYFSPPPNPPTMVVVSLVLDPEHAKAAVLGDGSATIMITHTADVARFVAAALSLLDWPEALIIEGDRLTLNEAVTVAESVIKVESRADRLLVVHSHGARGSGY
jgi:nucleoside-diphosphate-sugar epimerase